MGKNLPAMQETQVQSLGWEDPLANGMATHSSILAWRIPWTEEPGGVQSMRSQRVRHKWASTKTRTHTICLKAMCIHVHFLFHWTVGLYFLLICLLGCWSFSSHILAIFYILGMLILCDISFQYFSHSSLYFVYGIYVYILKMWSDLSTFSLIASVF